MEERSMCDKGFTLLELMIVVAIIAIVAAIAIPGLLRSRMAANEGSAVGALRSLATAQAQFQSQVIIDQNENGAGEYALLAELTGTSNCRSRSGQATPSVNPAFLPNSLAPRDANTYSEKAGYRFKVYLPGPNAITDNGTAGQIGISNNSIIFAQEQKYRAYAWPVSARNTGTRVFAMDMIAEIFSANNINAAGDAIYNDNNGIAYDAAVDLTKTDSPQAFENNLKPKVQGKDGQIWNPSNYN